MFQDLSSYFGEYECYNTNDGQKVVTVKVKVKLSFKKLPFDEKRIK